METSIADPPQPTAGAGPSPGQAGGNGNGAAAASAPGAGAAAAGAAGPAAAQAARRCSACDAPLAEGQEWCLQCGAGAPGSLGASGWRPAATVLAVTAALVLGAAAAAYAALSSSPPKARVVVATVARTPPPAATSTPTPTTPLGATPTPTAKVPALTVKPPKIPLTVTAPKTTVTTPAATTTTPSTSASGGSETSGEGSSGASGSGSEGSAATAIVLDTDAASTYNPYDLPAAGFGDPSLAIDGDSSTGWTAQVDPATAPTMAEGLLLDLKAPQKLSAIELITSTPGMTVQLYGANGATVPSSITEKAWVPLTHSTVVHKRHEHLKVIESKHGYRWVTLWISRAGASSVGTAQAPGRVSVNELELFPAS